MKGFITAELTNRRFSDEHRVLRDTAIQQINDVIKAAKEFPVAVPVDLFTGVACVRHELLRQLKEAGWEVESDYGAYVEQPIKCYFLFHRPLRIEERMAKK